MGSVRLSDDWDLDIDDHLDLAATDDSVDKNSAFYGESLAQDVAVACRVILGESYWDASFGVPYKQILGERAAKVWVHSKIAQTALTVAGVHEINVNLENYDKLTEDGERFLRVLKGEILINGAINAQL
jgi:hypothetical protein